MRPECRRRAETGPQRYILDAEVGRFQQVSRVKAALLREPRTEAQRMGRLKPPRERAPCHVGRSRDAVERM